MSTPTARAALGEPTMVTANGVELEVFEAGQENRGNPVVLCHGFPEHAFSWRHQIPALAAAGFHVIAPNQRGYGNSSCPPAETDYDLGHLCGDLVALLDHYGYDDATFVGHDWGANVVWGLALLHPHRVRRLVSLSLPYQARGDRPWLEVMEEMLGEEFYFVHLNRQPGVADAILDANTHRFLGNLFRTHLPSGPPPPGMALIDLAEAEAPAGDPLMSAEELAVFVAAFTKTGFTGSLNWYRNLDRNWHLLADVDPVVRQPALMVYGDRDPVARAADLSALVPTVEEVSLDCGHWIQQEEPEQVTRVILDWLDRQADGRPRGAVGAQA